MCKMKFIFLFVLLNVTVSFVFTVPINGVIGRMDLEEEYGVNNDIMQQYRVTCEHLTFDGFIGNSACTASCLSMGKAGGKCSGGICQCRATSYKDLSNKRFMVIPIN